MGPYTGEGADCLRDNLRRHSLQEKPGLGLWNCRELRVPGNRSQSSRKGLIGQSETRNLENSKSPNQAKMGEGSGGP